MHRLIQMSLFQLCCMLVSWKEGSNPVIHSMVVNVQRICCLLLFLAIAKCQREETVAVCGFPGIPAGAEIVVWNGRIRVDTIFKQNDVVEYRCRSGFRNFDTLGSTRTCHWNGTWLGETIQCQEQLYCNSENLLPGNWDSIYQCQFNRAVRISFIEFEFNGFTPEVSIQKGRQREVICHHFSSSTPFRKQYKELHRCNNVITNQVEFRYQVYTSLHYAIFSSARKCDDYPSVPANGIVSSKTDVAVEYRCKPGYQLHGNTFRRCDSQSGLWLPSLPQCRPELKMPPIKQETSTTTVQHTSSPRIGRTSTTRYFETSTPSYHVPSTTSSSRNKDTLSTKFTNQKDSGDSESGSSSGENSMGIIIAMSCISLLILIALVSLFIWFINRKRFRLSKERQSVAVLYNNVIATEDNIDDSCEPHYENLITLAINPSPIYSQLDFQNPNCDLYAAVDKTKKIRNQVKNAKITNNEMANTEHSTEVVYTTIKPHPSL